MGYIDNNLIQGESVTYRANLHWMTFLAPIVFVVFAILGFVIALPVGVFLLLCAIVIGLSRWLSFVSSEFAVTDKRVLVKVGLIRRRSIELLLSKVETIGVDQGILGRIFNFGTIIVTGTGGTKEPFTGIANPLEFRRQVQAKLLS
jgi:uncharacterized membrane protein YdbT with pleckstrin-like domain